MLPAACCVVRSRCSACTASPYHLVTSWAVSAVQEQSRREQAAQQAAQSARQQADQASAAVQSRERGLQDQQVLLQDAQRECAEYKRSADQAAEELSQEQHKRQRVQEDLVVSWRCNGLPLGLGAAADRDGLMHMKGRGMWQIGSTSKPTAC